MKKCKKCGEIKPIKEYYVHYRMADGHLNFCKECVKKRVSDYWYSNAEALREKDKLRCQERLLDPEYRAKREAFTKQFRTKEIQHAHNQVQRKLKNQKPPECPICGARKRIVGHHPNYQKPLEVIWCCTPCHRQIHLGRMEA